MPDGGYMMGMAPCFGCKRVFCFDPDRVPSITIDPQTRQPPEDTAAARERAVKEPVCPNCARRVNPERRKLGFEPIYEGDTVEDIGKDVPWIP